MTMKPGFVLILMFSCLVNYSFACGRRSSHPPDTKPPSLTCPNNIERVADPSQLTATVDWIEPRATDNFDGEVHVLRKGLGPGMLFSEGTHTIRYSATDRAGNHASCSFTINIRVVRCKGFSIPTDGYKTCNPNMEMRYGDVCRFGCNPGHELVGPSRIQCKIDGHWTSPTQPSCKKITCRREELVPTAAQTSIISYRCTDMFNYQSICTYSCKEGYSVEPGRSKDRVCGVNGEWVGAKPICKDISAPVYTNCPRQIIRYAERLQTSGRAYWNDPLGVSDIVVNYNNHYVTDNSNSITSAQTDGPSSGADLPVGVYDIRYRAEDDAGNRAICQFKLFMELITCPVIDSLPYTSVTCPTGRIWGSTCLFTCDNGTASSFPLETVCQRHGTDTHYGVWDFGNQQPYCVEENPCPDLRAPDNGALACDIWLGGRYCQMLCQNGYTVYESPGDKVHQRLLVCGNSGNWAKRGVIPDCVEKDHLEYAFYDGQCEDVIEEIREKFLLSFNTTLSGSCTPPKCNVDNVKVICGRTSKRSTSSTADTV